VLKVKKLSSSKRISRFVKRKEKKKCSKILAALFYLFFGVCGFECFLKTLKEGLRIDKEALEIVERRCLRKNHHAYHTKNAFINYL